MTERYLNLRNGNFSLNKWLNHISKELELKKLLAILFTPVSILMTLFTWLICPVLPLFVEYRTTQYSDTPVPVLKGWLYLLMTHDTDLDAGHRNGHYWTIDESSKWQVYWSRVRWIFRNPIYGFQHYVLGCWVVLPFIRYENADEVTDILDSGNNFCLRDRFTFCGLKLKYKWGWKLFRYQKTEDIWDGRQRAMFVASVMRDK